MEKRDLKVGDVVQISPEGRYKETYGGMFLVVTEPKSFGCMGYVLNWGDIPGTKFRGRAFLRPEFAEIEYVGASTWVFDEEAERKQIELEETGVLGV